jgi:DNA polymerase-3 subunit alpha
VLYTELHLHTPYSLLDGLNTPEEYMKRAKELGMTHLAQTDHGTNAGHRDFQKAAKSAGIVPILGQEMYISPTDRFDRRTAAKRTDGTKTFNHLIVLAQDEAGLSNLNRLSEIAWTEGFYSKPRIDMEVLEEYNEGLIVLSGCIGGLISKAIENNLPVLANQYTSEFARIFGDRFFMELQGHNPAAINKGLLELAERHGVKPVVTSDCHYAREEDLWLEEAMLILATSPAMNKGFEFSKSQKMDMIERFNYIYPIVDAEGNDTPRMTFQKYEIFLRSAEQHKAMLAKQGIPDEAVSNTMIVANMIGDYPYHDGLDLLPKPKGENADDLLEKKSWAGLKKRGFDKNEEYRARLREELDIIKNKNFSSYFLIEANAVTWAKSKGIRIGPGRGSGAGSLVNYALGITAVDPIKYGLLFFRFMDPARDDFPDIDTDVEDRRRSEIKGYLARQYKHVASIATFGTFQGKQAVRDAGRVFRVPLGDINKALKGADWPSQMDFFAEWAKTDKGSAFAKKYPEVMKLAKFMLGRIKSQGMHAGGIVVSNQPISNYAPMQSAKDNGDEAGTRIPLVAYDMNVAAEIGLIKYDFLGLKALSIISDTLKMVKDRHGVDIDLEELDLEDRAVYDRLSNGYTKGVFQCEATPYTNLLIKMGGVRNFDELVASNALVRPGAMNSTAGAAFIARKAGDEQIDYPHASMHAFTKETYGAVIYQEQVMLTMTELADMTMGQANKVRSIIGKKKDVSEFEAYKKMFIEGASKKVDEKVADRLWHDFEAHAGYSFNKSHAVAYSMLSYWTAWLKYKYPLEFMTAVLRNEGDKDSLLDYLVEAKRMGIKVVLPHVNASGIEFEIQEDERGEFIRFGLANIKYISGKIGNKLLEARPFSSYHELADLVATPKSGLSTRVLQSLNAIGGAVFPDHPRTGKERDNFFEYLNIPAFQTEDLAPKMKAQFRPLDEYSEADTFVSMAMVRGIKTGPGWARVDMVDEHGSAGVFAPEQTPIESGQMYVFLIAKNRIARYIKVADLINDQGGLFQEFLEATEFPDVPEGMMRVVAFQSRVTKAGKKMADAVFCNGDKELYAAMVFPQQFMKAYTRCKDGAVLDVVLKETQDGSLFVDNIL